MIPASLRRLRLSPADCIASLPDPKPDADTLSPGDELRGAELRKAILRVARLNHVSETTQVRAVVVAVRGAVPTVGD